MRYARDHGIKRFESSAAEVEAWTGHVKKLGEGNLLFEVNSWMTGVNANVEGKQVRIVNRYGGSAPDWRATCAAVVEKGYKGRAMA